MLSLLKPSGWLVFEEPDFSAARCLCGTEEENQAFGRVMQTIEIMYGTLGIDHATGLMVPKVLSALGVERLLVDNDAPASPGNSTIARMMGMSACQLKERYIQTKKCTPEDIDIYRSFAEDPETWAIYYRLCFRAERGRVRWDAFLIS
ncbi:putative methyltransferase [Leptospirillum ferriphilum]|uniref:Putative methyltransferase n=2 Tax=Leptospirillum ferriphilum TaxID=178606 RepID=A0A094YK85_9BACT|nr:putative methyltransferase [Leptospirillum ferriphilum]